MSVRSVVQMRFSGGMGGAESVALALAGILGPYLENSVAYFVLERRAGDKACSEMLERVKASGARYRVFYTDRRFSMRLLSELRRALAEDKAEIIHAHCYKSAFYSLALKNLVAGPVKRSVVTLHGLFEPPSLGLALIRTIDLLSTMLSDRVIGCSNEIASRYKRLPFVKGMTEVVQNGLVVDSRHSSERVAAVALDMRARMAELYGLDPSALWVACVGRLTGQKNFALYIKTVSEMITSGRLKRKCEFLIVGEGVLNAELRQMARESELDKSLFFTSYIADTDMLYSSIDMLMQTSVWEGTPICLLEAMAYGKPVVATSVGGVPDVIEDGVNGFLATTGDSAKLASLATLLLNDDLLRRNIGRKAAETVLKRHSHEVWAKRHFSIYNALLGSV